jgi:hypothetical protein
MNRGNVLQALDDEEIQSLAAQCHAATLEFAREFCARDFILAAVLHAEEEGDFSLESVGEHLGQQLADCVLVTREVRDYAAEFERWLATDDEELGEVRAPLTNLQ